MSNRQDAYYDAVYDAWSQGGNPDAVDFDRIDDRFYNEGLSWEESSAAEAERAARRPGVDDSEDERQRPEGSYA